MNPGALHSEVQYRTARSSGAGGQHVNKVETKVDILFDIQSSGILNSAQKRRLTGALKNRINKEGMLIVSAQDSRSQHKNKEKALQRFDYLIKQALKPRKKRKGPQQFTANRQKRLQNKKAHSEKKALRKKIRP